MREFCKVLQGINPSLIGGTFNAHIVKTMERKDEKDKGPLNVVIIRVFGDLVPIIHSRVELDIWCQNIEFSRIPVLLCLVIRNSGWNFGFWV